MAEAECVRCGATFSPAYAGEQTCSGGCEREARAAQPHPAGAPGTSGTAAGRGEGPKALGAILPENTAQFVAGAGGQAQRPAAPAPATARPAETEAETEAEADHGLELLLAEYWQECGYPGTPPPVSFKALAAFLQKHEEVRAAYQATLRRAGIADEGEVRAAYQATLRRAGIAPIERQRAGIADPSGVGGTLIAFIKLLRAYAEAHRPRARPDDRPYKVIPALGSGPGRQHVDPPRGGVVPGAVVSGDRRYQQAALPNLPAGEPTALQPVRLPHLVPPDRGLTPPAWRALLAECRAVTAGHYEAWRLYRLLILAYSYTGQWGSGIDRVGSKRVELPLAGPDGLIRALWPAGPNVARHVAPLRRVLALTGALWLPLPDGGHLIPVRPAAIQPEGYAALDVTYPGSATGGARYDRAAFIRYGGQPGRLATYLTAMWALDATDGPALVDLDAFIRAARYPDIPGGQVLRNARRQVRGYLREIVDAGNLGDYELRGGRGTTPTRLWLAPPPDWDQTD